jgi:very-short-patch-repair endonuclease
MIKNGKIVCCSQCEQEVYKPLNIILRSKNHFCSPTCANDFQKRNKVSFECKTCQKEFHKSKSELTKAESRNHKIQYCSIDCRNKDTARMTQKAQSMNEIQFNKKGLNKLEIAGREWLQALGFIHNVDFFEQILLFDKFTVDVYFPKYLFVVQFDGFYWHSKPKRVKLDSSQDAYLNKAGLRVFRITDIQMKSKDYSLFQSKMNEFLTAFNPDLNRTQIVWNSQIKN